MTTDGVTIVEILQERSIMFVVAIGDLFDRMLLEGPFENADQAIEYAERNYDYWYIVSVETPRINNDKV